MVLLERFIALSRLVSLLQFKLYKIPDKYGFYRLQRSEFNNSGACMDKLETMRIFMRVADLESFTRASESLGIPKATMSLSIQHLEASLHSRLLHRNTRKVQLT